MILTVLNDHATYSDVQDSYIVDIRQQDHGMSCPVFIGGDEDKCHCDVEQLLKIHWDHLPKLSVAGLVKRGSDADAWPPEVK